MTPWERLRRIPCPACGKPDWEVPRAVLNLHYAWCRCGGGKAYYPFPDPSMCWRTRRCTKDQMIRLLQWMEEYPERDGHTPIEYKRIFSEWESREPVIDPWVPYVPQNEV